MDIKTKRKTNMNNNTIWQSYEVKNQIEDVDLYTALRELMTIYKTSDFLAKIADLQEENQNIKTTKTGSFTYKDKIIFNYIPRDKIESSRIAYERSRQIGSELTSDYEFAVIDNSIANSFSLIKLNNNETFNDYSDLQDLSALSSLQKKELYKAIVLLAKSGIVFSPSALLYNTKNKKFKIIDYSKLSIDGFHNQQEKKAYLDSYKEFLSL